MNRETVSTEFDALIGDSDKVMAKRLAGLKADVLGAIDLQQISLELLQDKLNRWTQAAQTGGKPELINANTERWG